MKKLILPLLPLFVVFTTLSGQHGDPTVSLSVSEIDATLYYGESDTIEVEITNSGDSDILWSLEINDFSNDQITFTKSDYADWTLPENQDSISHYLRITRCDQFAIYNAYSQVCDHHDYMDGAEWAVGSLDDLESLYFDSFVGVLGHMVGINLNQWIIPDNQPMVLHDLYEDVYYEVQFLSWTSGMEGGGGGFSYTRSEGTTGWLNVTGFDNGTFFEKADYADYTDSTNWDIVADSVAITRADSEGLFNPYTDTGFSHWTDAMPAGTEWAWGATEEDDQDYTSWYSAVYQSGWGPAYALESSMEGYTDGHTMSMHLIEEDLYYDVEFHDWTCCAGGGGFSYTRYQVSPDGISIENTLSANSSDTLTIILGGSSLSPGEYSAEMIIGTSDTDTPELVVDIDLTVIGTPVLVLSTDSLDYDSLFIGLESLQFVELLNSGNDLLTITSVSSNNSEFQVSLEDDSVDVMESTFLTVTYVPATDGAISGQITIESNDLTNPTLTVQLTAVGQVPPEIELSVDSLEVFVSPEDSTTRYFTISNTGPNNLVYNISMDDIGSQTVTFTKEDWADWTLPENQDRVSDNLWITRGDHNALFNATFEYPDDHPHGPGGTAWAVGPLEDIEMLWFDSFVNVLGHNVGNALNGDLIPNNWPMVMHDLYEDIYYEVQFHSWTTGGNGGGFSYTRTRDAYRQTTDRSSIGFHADEPRRHNQALHQSLPGNITQGLAQGGVGHGNDRDQGDIINTYYTGKECATGLEWVGQDLYIVGWCNNEVYKFDVNTNALTYSFTTHEFAYGIAWDGAYLWIGDNVGIVYGYDLNGNNIGSFYSPTGGYSSITFNGENFIIRDPWEDDAPFYEIDYTGSVVNMFYGSATDTTATWEIAQTGFNALCGIDYNNNRIVEISLNDDAGTYTVVGEMDFEVGDLYYPIAYNGNLWSQDWSQMQLYEVEYHGADWGLEWLELSAYSGNIPANQSETIAVEFFGSDLVAGKYDAVMYIASNDVDNPVVELNATMRVMGPPRVSPPNELGFGELQFMESTYRDVHVTNYDSVDLTLTASMMYDFDSFELMNTTLTVPPKENGVFSVMAQSDLDEGWYSDTLVINTSHPDLATVHINTWVQSVPWMEPIILDIADVPDDQGGWVILEFTRSYYDDWWATGRTELYTIELYDGNNWIASNSSVAYMQNRYFSLVHTLEDSNSVSEGVTDFRVVAGMNEGTWISEVGSGYSMDNLPPGIPTGLIAEQEAEFIRVSWQNNTDEEIQYYEVHKSSNMDFIDNQYSIFTITDTLMTDTDFTIGETYYYRLGAVDLAGNMSDYSSVVSITMLSIDDILIPDEFALHQNYPNPFNPVTTLRYDLPEDAMVNIIIHDMLGKQVKTLINNQNQGAGYKSLMWDATNDYGKPVSAGIYLFTIQAGEYISTKKMVLLK